MKKYRSIIALLLCAFLLCACGNEQKPDESTGVPTESTSAELVYSVTLVDPTGAPVSGGVIVNFLSGTEVVAMQTPNEMGVAEKSLPRGEYSVELGFTDPNAAYHYDASALKLTGQTPAVQIILANEAVVEDKTYSSYDPVTGEESTYHEYVYHAATGYSYIPLDTDQRTYVYFTPKEAGLYQFSIVGADVTLGYYGSPYFIQELNLAEPDENGAFTINVAKGMIGTNGTGTSVLVLGIDGNGESDCIISIQRIADPEMTIEDYPWEIYAATVEIGKFTMSQSVRVLNFDLTADGYALVLNSVDGFYHLNTEDGPLVYAKLGASTEYLDSVQKILEVSGMSRYFYDEEGNFVKKISYTECLLEYIAAMDEGTGLYPLTEDLAHIFQQRGEYVGWWDVSGNTYIFVDDNGNPVPGINPEIAWLFLCCYSADDAVIVDPQPEPSDPTTEPTEPSTEPSDPTTEPSTEPSEPETEPTEPPHTHSYSKTVVAPGCTTDGYTHYQCECGEEYTAEQTEATGHSWGEWEVTKEPTETQVGEKQRQCGNCGEKETGEIPVLIPEHTHSYSAQVTKEASCAAEGEMTYSCSCGASYTESIAILEHTFKTAVTAPTCTQKGYTTYTCTACEKSYVSDETDPLGHEYTTKVTEPTCAQNGYTTYTCSVCGDTYTVEGDAALGHSWGEWVVVSEPTLTAEGLQKRTCSVCNETEEGKIDSLIGTQSAADPVEIWYHEIADSMSFDAAVKAGEYATFELYRLFDMVLTIESADVYILFEDQVIEPVNGVLTFELIYGSNDVSSPCTISIGNLGEADSQFHATLQVIPGTQNNPVELELGTFSTKTREGDEQGFYYTYTAQENGVLTVVFESIDVDANCVISLYNLNSYTYMVETNTSVSLSVRAGDVIQIAIATTTDEYTCPAATIVATLMME